MLEYPEIKTIAAQAGDLLQRKEIQAAKFLTPEKKFVFSSNSPQEFSERLEGQSVHSCSSCGNHLFIVMKSGAALNIGDTGGKILYHSDITTMPKKHDIRIDFSDGTTLTHSVVMWGFFGAQTQSEMDASIQRIKDEAREPVRGQVTLKHFLAFLASLASPPFLEDGNPSFLVLLPHLE